MKSFTFNRFHLVMAASIVAVFGCNVVLAGAYQLSREYNAVEIGNSGSGGAALASDASTAWANPAGMVRFKQKQVVVSGDALFTYAKFDGSNRVINTAFPVPFTQTGTARTTDSALIPALYFVSPLNIPGWLPDKWSAGLSINSPFGLSTNYGNNSVIRYSATLAKIQVIDFSPNIAFKATPDLSFGLGFDVDRVGINLRTKVGIPARSPALDTASQNVGNGWGYGFHSGVMYQMTKQTRLGLTYHSSVNATVSGYSSLIGPLVRLQTRSTDTISSNSFRTKFILPPYTVLSANHEINSAWAVNGTLGYTQWAVLNGELTAFNLAGLPSTGGRATISIPQHYKNTWLMALGGSYQINSAWMLRAGASFDQSPVKSSERIVIIPDSNRVALSVGAHYQVNQAVGFDAGYMYMTFNDASVSAPLKLASQTSTATGNYNNSHVNILGLQMNWNIA